MNVKQKAVQANDSELCLNLWYYLDAEAGFIYAFSGRAYWLSGSDEEKLHTLKKLSATDYKMARRFRLPDRFKLHFGDEVKSGYATPDMIRAQGINAFEEILQELEEEFLPIPITIDGDILMKEMKIPNDALCLYTALKEVAVGEIIPVVS